MARGGYRPGQGRPKGVKNGDAQEDINVEAEKLNLSPLEYMLMVMNDTSADPARRDRMAGMAAPFIHAKPGEKGKKAEKDDEAKNVAKNRFKPASPPALKAVKG